MEVPTIDHPTGRENYSEVTVDGITYFFSYSTCIGFCHWAGTPVVRVNEWSTTTGKHLDYIDGGNEEAKNRRVHEEMFLTKLQYTPAI